MFGKVSSIQALCKCDSKFMILPRPMLTGVERGGIANAKSICMRYEYHFVLSFLWVVLATNFFEVKELVDQGEP